jgi:5-methylthioadenosine/S-adenosylhomocysteine deaminase
MPEPAFAIRPVVSWPREATAGRRYLMTIDLEPDDPQAAWPYAGEEILVHCLVDSAPLFISEPMQDTAVVLHRFGGSYGPVRYVLTAAERPMTGSIHLALVNANGAPVGGYDLGQVSVVAEGGAEGEVVARVPRARRAAPPPRGNTVLRGRIVTLDASSEVIENGALYVDADGRIAGLLPAAAPAPSGFADARTIEARGSIYPGLIDLHVLPRYSMLPLWIPPGREQPFTSRYQWPGQRTYDEAIVRPAKALSERAPEAVARYAAVRALVGGTTTVRAGRELRGQVVRNAAYDFAGKGPWARSSIAPLRAERDFEASRRAMQDGRPFFCHIAEGTDPKLVEEFVGLREHGCVRPELVGVHGVALGPKEFHEWSEVGGHLVWCPFSSLWWYAHTADVRAAADAGLNISLSSDWSPSGTKNPLGILKVADMWNRERLEGLFSDEQLCRMVTSNPAAALRWDDRIGRLRPGMAADLVAIADRESDPYRNLVGARERDVQLVMVGGVVAYGAADLVDAAGSDAVEVEGEARRYRLPASGRDDLTWSSVIDELVSWAGALPDVPTEVDSLVHDAAFFERIARNPMHRGLLTPLASYFGT